MSKWFDVVMLGVMVVGMVLGCIAVAGMLGAWGRMLKSLSVSKVDSSA